MLEALRIKQELERRARERKILSYYPDTGPLRRELYPKHMEFFEAGAKHRERLMLAANRVGKCCTINSLIETPDGELPIFELLKRDKFEVWAWDGEKRVKATAHRPFRKSGLHECYRITFSDGRWIECADHHRILCADGWRLLSELLPVSVSAPPETTPEPGQQAQFSDDVHWWGKLQDSIHRYFEDFRLCGVPLPLAVAGVLAFVPSPGDALPRSQPESYWDGLASTHTSSRQSGGVLPSSMDDLPRIGARCAESSIHTALPIAERWSGRFRGFRQWLLGSLASLRSFPWRELESLQKSVLAYEPLYVDSNRIISCESIGRKEVYDFTVDLWHNYIAAGIVHHNSEGAGGYEVTLHATGWYPPWWNGKRFDKPIDCWVAGDTGITVRDILQSKLLGPVGQWGTGLIPGECIERITRANGLPDKVDTISVRSKFGGMSRIGFKSYDQRRESFQGTEKDVVWLDEEPPLDIYTECLLRTMDIATQDFQGIVILTFTPLMGMSDVVLSFLPGGKLEQAQA